MIILAKNKWEAEKIYLPIPDASLYLTSADLILQTFFRSKICFYEISENTIPYCVKTL